MLEFFFFFITLHIKINSFMAKQGYNKRIRVIPAEKTDYK